MTDAWPTVPLGDVLTQRREFILIDDAAQYKRCRVQLHAKGVELRDIVSGAGVKTKKQQVCKPGEFLVAEIDAKVGGFGLVPDHLEGAIVSSHYFLFGVSADRLDRRFLDYYVRTKNFRDQVTAQGSTNYAAIRPGDVLGYTMPLPPLLEQRRVVARIEELAGKIEEARGLRREAGEEGHHLLSSLHSQLIQGADYLPMGEIAPLVRRVVELEDSKSYHELGVRSFGKGTFHKPAVDGLSLGTKRVFRILPEDLVFNIVFAWEGAVAVAKPEDVGRVGSHRFLTCVPKPGAATSNFLLFYFLSREGIEKLGQASPGGAGRNRTLSLKGLENIKVPVPLYERQVEFDSYISKMQPVGELQAQTAAELDALLPSVLDRAFSGRL